MEVDGVVSEIGGDTNLVNVKMRESRKGNIGNQIKIQLENVMGANDDVDVIAVIDSKRKHMEDMMDGDFIGDNNDQMLMDQSSMGPKKRTSGGFWILGPPDIMSLIVWNFHGLAPPRAVQFLKEINQQFRSSIIFSCEILVKKIKLKKYVMF